MACVALEIQTFFLSFSSGYDRQFPINSHLLSPMLQDADQEVFLLITNIISHNIPHKYLCCCIHLIKNIFVSKSEFYEFIY